jgi:hypothetical protein
MVLGQVYSYYFTSSPLSRHHHTTNAPFSFFRHRCHIILYYRLTSTLNNKLKKTEAFLLSRFLWRRAELLTFTPTDEYCLHHKYITQNSLMMFGFKWVVNGLCPCLVKLLKNTGGSLNARHSKDGQRDSQMVSQQLYVKFSLYLSIITHDRLRFMDRGKSERHVSLPTCLSLIHICQDVLRNP